MEGGGGEEDWRSKRWRQTEETTPTCLRQPVPTASQITPTPVPLTHNDLVKQNSQDTSRTGSGTPRRSLVTAPAAGSKAEQGPPSQATDSGLSVTSCFFQKTWVPSPGQLTPGLSPPQRHPNPSCFLGSIPDASPRKTGAGNLPRYKITAHRGYWTGWGGRLKIFTLSEKEKYLWLHR